jgi:hypothetical protein
VTFENEDENLEIAESNVSGVEIFTSSSYDWIVAIMTFFIGEETHKEDPPLLPSLLPSLLSQHTSPSCW